MVLVCHEANDIFLELAKMARYAEASETVTTGCFILFMLSWFATRIYAFGFIVIKSTLFESYKRAEQVKVNIEPHTTILNGFLIFLYILHIYWSYLIVRIAVRQLVGGELNDIREEHEEEEEEIVADGGGSRAVKPTVLNPAKVGSVGHMPSNM
jgi:ceramide synthetase